MARRPSEGRLPEPAQERPEAQLQLFEHVGFRQNAQTTEAVSGRAPACAGATERAFCKDLGLCVL